MYAYSTIEKLLASQAVDLARGHIADADYALPAADWIAQDFAQFLRGFLQFENLQQWLPETWDCDNFADLSAVLAAICHAKTNGRTADTGLAFGKFWYMRDADGAGHAINFAVVGAAPESATFDSDDLRLAFFEPQTQQIVTLTATEIRSCTAFLI